MPYVYPPVPINTGVSGGNQPPTPIPGSGQVNTGPFLFGGNLYVFLRTVTLAGTCVVFKSTDNGVTWAGVDIAGSSAGVTFATSFDSVHTVRCAFAGDSTNFVPIQFQDFNLSTETWGTATPGGPNASGILGAAFLGSGDFLVIYNASNTAVTSYAGVIFSGATWGTPFQIDANATTNLGPNHQFLNFGYVMNSGNTVMHAVFPWEGTGGLDFACYQQINQNGTLGPFTSFAVGGSSLQGNAEAIPTLYGNNVVISFSQSSSSLQSIFVGTPAAAPVFTNVGPIDPGFPADANLIGNTPGQFLVISGILYLVYIANSTDGTTFNRVRLLQTSSIADPSLGWSGTDIFDGQTQGGAGWVQGDLRAPAVKLDVNGKPSVSFTSFSTDGLLNEIRFWLQFSGAVSTLAISGNPGPGQVGVPYSSCYSATGGTPPYTFSITSGFLPPGLSLNPSTGCITGTPKLKGTFCFGVTVSDSLFAVASQSNCITINNAFASADYGAAKQPLHKPCRTTELDWAHFARILDAVKPEPLPETQQNPCLQVPNWRVR